MAKKRDEEFLKKFENFGNFDRPDLNLLILNYLVTEGYQETSMNFANEIGLNIQGMEELNINRNDDINLQNKKKDSGKEKENAVDDINMDAFADQDSTFEEEAIRKAYAVAEFDDHRINQFNNSTIINGLHSIKQRNEIKKMIGRGEIEGIIDKLNDYYPFLLENNDFLYFKILLLSLIESIKKFNKEREIMIKNETNFVPSSSQLNKNINKRKHRKSSTSINFTSSNLIRYNLMADASNSSKVIEFERKFYEKTIKFIRNKIFPNAIKSPVFMEELELALCLLLFDTNNTEKTDKSLDGNSSIVIEEDNQNFLPIQLSHLSDNHDLKHEVFDLINNSILTYSTNKFKMSDEMIGNYTTISSNQSQNKGSNSTDDMNSNMDMFTTSDFDFDSFNTNKNKYTREEFFDDDDDEMNLDKKPDGEKKSKYHRSNNPNNLDNFGSLNPDKKSESPKHEETNFTVNSKFRQLINLWLYSEQVLIENNIEFPRLDLGELIDYDKE
ncbi:glucose-induced degradation complex subunit GID8 ASCRUDRAFT_6060 [Ascoidea rubescens DSM 1968]|uniref:CTLH domain-containing protein n=1 Tax=Ascoidea rubescens DSM 1968 TaxID=1344418 RepID=A0A1D2VRG8_9ASCO|nr:hypothetical protein ASCRUDRAFT_6060 [Ascoidea rubescens DSM 1968]ODV64201.1 hypothetical protein ASCRUDRAFT_6060 [Ascoidea rubescens DSM 1968]